MALYGACVRSCGCLCWLTVGVGPGGGAVAQQDVDELEANGGGLQADLDQHGLDVG